MSSGSSRSASRDDSTISTNSTVTSLRSPSSDGRVVKIFSARYLGV
jgi:hypothetical protein